MDENRNPQLFDHSVSCISKLPATLKKSDSSCDNRFDFVVNSGNRIN